MSEENVEVVLAMLAAFDAMSGGGGDVEAFVLDYYDPDCEFLTLSEGSEALRGHEANISWTERWLDSWTYFHDEVVEVVDAGDVVFTEIMMRSRGRGSGISIRQRIFVVYEMRDGKILREREYRDRDDALEAAGLRE